MRCTNCGSFDLDKLIHGNYVCNDCGQIVDDYDRRTIKPMKMSPYERTRAAVYATGNKWAIENFNATH